MTVTGNVQSAPSYLDFQAYVGITKHNGGSQATNDLLSLCHIDSAREVLNVGCGIGVSSAYIARKYGCRVVGVDISEKMIEWSRLRAKEERVEDRVEFQVADVLGLPFDVDHFDVVMVESVLAFVADKPRALAECVRVTRPGGYVGLNESLWIKQPTAEMQAQMLAQAHTYIPSAEEWQALWEQSGLLDRMVSIREIDARYEVRDRLQWVGRRWAIGAFGRLIRLYLTHAEARQSIRDMFGFGLGTDYLGYGLFAGRK